MWLIEIEDDRLLSAFFQFLFIEDGLGDDVLFSGPVTEVPVATAFAAEWKIGV
jgi:hypothetical protein